MREKGIEIVLPSEDFNSYGNTIQIGDSTETTKKCWLNAEGELDAYFNKVVVESGNKRKSSDSYTAYAQTQETYVTSDGGFPINLAGTIRTIRYSRNYYDCRQTFEVAVTTQTVGSRRRNKIYERYVDSHDTWTSFRRVASCFTT